MFVATGELTSRHCGDFDVFGKVRKVIAMAMKLELGNLLQRK